MPESFKATCGTCAYGHPSPDKDFRKRLCFGAPPQILIVPQPPQFAKGPDGQMKQISPATIAMQNARPIVPASDPACAQYERRMIVAAEDGQDVAVKQ